MKIEAITSLIFAILFLSCNPEKSNTIIYDSGDLVIEKLTENVFVHTSFLDIPSYGPFPCNGMIYKNRNEAVVFDTPVTDSVSTELINRIKSELDCEIKAVVVNHFHVDCLGGLNAFHQNGIISYANQLTIDLAKANNTATPQTGFKEDLTIKIGDSEILNRYFGEGHSKDNIVSYIPSQQILFGGCMIKEVGAGKGNLKDANTTQWPITVQQIKDNYPDLKVVVPGHGKAGGIELLDYTIELFLSRD